MQTWRRIVNLLHGIADTQGKETNIVHFIMQANTQNVVKRNQVLSLFRIFLKELKLIELRHSNEKKVRFPVTFQLLNFGQKIPSMSSVLLWNFT